MNEKDILIIQRMMAEHSLSAETERRLLKMLEEGRREWTEEKRERPVVTTEGSRPGITYIDCPYSRGEKEKIMEWIRKHGGHDEKALAVALWLSGGIAPREIANLRTEDWKDGKTAGESPGYDRGTSWQRNRGEIMKNVLKLHPDGLKYVFMRRKGSEWAKLKSGSLQMKMYNICDELGIVYKSFHQNEAIRYDGK